MHARLVCLALTAALAIAPASTVRGAGPDPAAPRAIGLVDPEPLCVMGPGARLHRFSTEVARTPEQRSRGLMYRRELPADAGMLFVFDDAGPVSMWMKNTLIPLDMLFIDEHGSIVRIAARTEPLSERHIPSGGPVVAVLELAGGETEARAIRVGDRVLHPALGRPCPR